MAFDVNKIREDFPILKRKVNGHPLVYIDNAGKIFFQKVDVTEEGAPVIRLCSF